MVLETRPSTNYLSSHLQEIFGMEKYGGNSLPSSDYWDIDAEVNKLLRLFPYKEGERLITGAVDLLQPLNGRFQLGMKPIFDYLPDGSISAYVPSFAEASKNNRLLHSLKVARSTQEVIQQWGGVDDEARERLAAVTLFHDLYHYPLSHTGEGFYLKMVEKATKGSDGLLPQLKTYNLAVDHDDRLVAAADNEGMPLGQFLYSHFSYDGVEQIKAGWEEKHSLWGRLKSVMDTAKYLEHDSLYFGYTPPDFIDRLKRGLTPFRKRNGEYILAMFWKNDTTLAEMLAYRQVLYHTQYSSPPGQVLQQMQVKALERFVEKPSGVDRSQTIAHKMRDIDRLSDGELVVLMRRRALMDQSFDSLGFFGILPVGVEFVISPDKKIPRSTELMKMLTKPKSVALYDREKRSAVNISASTSPLATLQERIPLLRTTHIDLARGSDSFWPEIKPFLHHLCSQFSPNGATNKITPDAIEKFYSQYYGNGKLVSNSWNAQERQFAETVFFKLLTTDSSWSYTYPSKEFF